MYNQAVEGRAWAQIVLNLQKSCVTLVIQECFLPSTCNMSLKNPVKCSCPVRARELTVPYVSLGVYAAVHSLGNIRQHMLPREHMAQYTP